MTTFFSRRGCSNSANLMSARLVFSRKFHTAFVRLPAERTKVVNIGAPLNRLSFATFFPTKSKFMSGFSALQSLKSAGDSSGSTKHCESPGRPCRSSVEADLALWGGLSPPPKQKQTIMVGLFGRVSDVSSCCLTYVFNGNRNRAESSLVISPSKCPRFALFIQVSHLHTMQ